MCARTTHTLFLSSTIIIDKNQLKHIYLQESCSQVRLNGMGLPHQGRMHGNGLKWDYSSENWLLVATHGLAPNKVILTFFGFSSEIILVTNTVIEQLFLFLIIIRTPVRK